MELSAAGARDLAGKLELPIGFVGFVAGVTAKDAAFNGAGYRSNIPFQLKDFIGHLGISGVTVAPGYTSQANFSFNPLGFINNGFWGALGLWGAKTIAGQGFGIASKIVNVVHDYGMPFAIGYSIGGFIDPPPSANQIGAIQTYGTASAAQAQAASYYNNLLSAGQ